MIRFEIHGDNLTITDAIRNYIEGKVGKLKRYFNDVPNAVAHVRVKTYSSSATKIEVAIPLKNVTLRAEEQSGDLYAGIDLINDKLEKQVRRYKTRINRKSHDRGDQEVFVIELQEMQETQVDNSVYGDDEIEVIRSKEFSLKPVDSEEAVLQMNLLGHDFLVFTDRKADGTSTVYRRKNGKYGLVQTSEQ